VPIATALCRSCGRVSWRAAPTATRKRNPAAAGAVRARCTCESAPTGAPMCEIMDELDELLGSELSLDSDLVLGMSPPGALHVPSTGPISKYPLCSDDLLIASSNQLHIGQTQPLVPRAVSPRLRTPRTQTCGPPTGLEEVYAAAPASAAPDLNRGMSAPVARPTLFRDSGTWAAATDQAMRAGDLTFSAARLRESNREAAARSRLKKKVQCTACSERVCARPECTDMRVKCA
jgi:hypothetical protein